MNLVWAFLAGAATASGAAVFYFRSNQWYLIWPTKEEAVVQVTIFPGEKAFIKTKNVREWIVR